jgi:hypothetical protein
VRGKKAKQLKKIARELEERLATLHALAPEEVTDGRVSLYRKLKKEYSRGSR